MDKEQVKKAFDDFEDENYYDAEDALKKQIKQAKNDYLKSKLDLKNDVEDIEPEEDPDDSGESDNE